MPFRLVPPRDRTLYRHVKRADEVTLRKGRSIYAPGDDAREVWLVREGYVRLVLPGMEQGRGVRTVGVALPWEVFGDEALTAGRRRYGAVAGSRCVVQPLVASGFLRGLKTARRSLDAYLRGVERELHRLRHAQGGSGGPTAAQRLAEVLLDLGERCGEPVGRGIRLSERMTHQVLADLAGAHRATVTTLLNDWLYEGVLQSDAAGRLVIARPAGLWSRAGYLPAEEEGRGGAEPSGAR
ncbi:MAG TPA: Crp/Fnr family transcriptional regulator [Longimicrobiales bacterium]|nr:Crp/Fnr family transcriptional regulator [Longimicrobiales bacterium]